MNVRRGSNPHATMSLAFSPRQPSRVVQTQVLPQELLVVRELDHQRDFERLLQPLREVERDEVAEVQTLRRRPAAGVQVKLFTLLVRGDDLIELAVREEHAAAQERVRLASRDCLDAFDQALVNHLTPEIVHELQVVDLAVRPARDVPGRHHLLGGRLVGGIGQRRRRGRGGHLVDAGHLATKRAGPSRSGRAWIAFGGAPGKEGSPEPRRCVAAARCRVAGMLFPIRYRHEFSDRAERKCSFGTNLFVWAISLKASRQSPRKSRKTNGAACSRRTAGSASIVSIRTARR